VIERRRDAPVGGLHESIENHKRQNRQSQRQEKRNKKTLFDLQAAPNRPAPTGTYTRQMNNAAASDSTPKPSTASANAQRLSRAASDASPGAATCPNQPRSSMF